MEYFEKDQLYRVSGDEFVIICPKVQEEVFIRQAQLLKERLKQEEQGLAAFGYLWNDGTTAADRLLHGAEQPDVSGKAAALPGTVHAECRNVRVMHKLCINDTDSKEKVK